MLNWNDIILSLLKKANSDGKKLYIEITDADRKTEYIYFDTVDEKADSIAIKFTRR